MHNFVAVFIVLISSQLLVPEPFIVIYFKMGILMTYEHVQRH